MIVRSAIASFVVLISVLGAARTAIPAEGLPAAGVTGDRSDDAESGGPRRPIDPRLKKQAVSLGFFMIAVILAAGTLLLVLVVTWGNRTRRLARSPLPPVGKPDELWFLKPKKEVNSAKSDKIVGPDGPSETEGGG